MVVNESPLGAFSLHNRCFRITVFLLCMATLLFVILVDSWDTNHEPPSYDINIKNDSIGGYYIYRDPNHNVREYYEHMLKRHGMETTRLHSFKSPYIVDPIVYDDAIPLLKAPGKRKTKYISLAKTKAWFVNEGANTMNRDFKRCPYSECEFDGEAQHLAQADVVLFMARAMPRTVPPRPMGQIWAFCSWENPLRFEFPSIYEPWKSVFNWSISYRLSSDFFFPINRLAWRDSETLLTDSQYEQIARRKTKTAVWFVSNCITLTRRELYVRKMMKYIDIDIFGACGKKGCPPEVCNKKLNDTYKFYLSFENTNCKDYVTEKFFRNYDERIQIVPVVRGGFDYENYFPPNTFINARNFSDAKALALFLKDLGNDIGRYSAMLKEKDRLKTLNYKHDWCEFCEKLHTGDFPHKVIPDIKKDTVTAGICPNGGRL